MKQETPATPYRFWELDFSRGIALVGMVIYHFMFDLDFLGIINLNILSLAGKVFQKSIAGLFLLIVGISLTLSYSKIKDTYSPSQIWKKYLRRGAQLLSLAVLITLVTYLFFPKYTVLFGVLHFIAVAIMLSPLFLRFYYLNLIVGIIALVVGIFMQKVMVSTGFFLWLGLRYPGFTTFDYYPLFPWFGIVLIGLFLGKMMYPEGKQWCALPEFMVTKPFSWMGKKSLLLYLLHQPILFGILYLFLLIG